MDFKFDKMEHCKRMIANNSYLIPNSKGKEDMWLMAYCKQMNMDKQQTYDTWAPIYKSRFTGAQQDELDMEFNKWFYKKSTVKTWKLNQIKIYKSEVDYIESQPVIKYYKEFALMVLAYSKSIRTEKDGLTYKPEKAKLYTSWCKSIPSKPRNDQLKVLEQMGIIKPVTIRTWDKIEGCWELNELYMIQELPQEGDVLVDSTYLFDCQSLFTAFTQTKVCPSCGVVFEYGSKCKRDVCEECYKRQRMLNIKMGAIEYYYKNKKK